MGVRIGSGRDPLIPAVARQLAQDLRDLEQDVFTCGGDGVTVHGMALPLTVTSQAAAGGL
ncbi:hypothetical protein [Streptomyces sp. NPDC050538]|uniref:hypothetical protein n=1 Tax=Streptomyces sp. NPDC050538 TaxID=3365627 RepID=UPI00378779AF